MATSRDREERGRLQEPRTAESPYWSHQCHSERRLTCRDQLDWSQSRRKGRCGTVLGGTHYGSHGTTCCTPWIKRAVAKIGVFLSAYPSCNLTRCTRPFQTTTTTAHRKAWRVSFWWKNAARASWNRELRATATPTMWRRTHVEGISGGHKRGVIAYVHCSSGISVWTASREDVVTAGHGRRNVSVIMIRIFLYISWNGLTQCAKNRLML